MIKTHFRLRNKIFSENRRNLLIKFLGKRCDKIARAYFNEDRDFVRNGEKWLIEKMSSFVKEDKNQVIFDVGANVGQWAKVAAHYSPQTPLYSFEPVPDTFDILKNNTSSLSNILCFPFGLSNQKIEQQIYLNQSSDVASLYQRVDCYHSKSVQARFITGDQFVKDNNIAEIGFLKIDVEGAEHLVLEGFKETLKQNRIQVILFEYGEFNIASRVLLKDYYQSLDNYHIGRLFPNYIDFSPWHKDLENFRPANYVAVARDQKDIIAELSGGGKYLSSYS